MPPNAVPIGKPMASTEPNARIKITIANAKPSASEVGASNAANTSPPYSTCTPGTAGASARISSYAAANCSALVRLESSVTLANAVLPSREICAAPRFVNGLATW